MKKLLIGLTFCFLYSCGSIKLEKGANLVQVVNKIPFDLECERKGWINIGDTIWDEETIFKLKNEALKENANFATTEGDLYYCQ